MIETEIMRKRGGRFMADTPKFFDASDLTDVFKELNAANEKMEEIEDDVEMAASQRRFEEIIMKHRENGGKGNE